ncbi:uncharacterized protein G2W53_012118 [Senna tora]|uniref:Uncharacterized protein n=1 Tax=Senna tora TaxID=362788 RepID=A0A834TWC5_9FABA|nr:uncharacterized protein G2W53_012118 [Senna tora]
MDKAGKSGREQKQEIGYCKCRASVIPAPRKSVKRMIFESLLLSIASFFSSHHKHQMQPIPPHSPPTFNY